MQNICVVTIIFASPHYVSCSSIFTESSSVISYHKQQSENLSKDLIEDEASTTLELNACNALTAAFIVNR